MIKKKLLSVDYILLLLVLCIAVFGVVIIGSATRININGTGREYSNQMIWIGTGILLMVLAASVDYRLICKLYIPIYIINIILLVLVLLLGRADETGVKRWLFGIQPSEFSKIFIIIYMSKFIDKSREKINNIGVLLTVALTTLVSFVLIEIEPSLSASLVVLVIVINLLFVGGISPKYIIGVLAVVLPLMIVGYLDLKSEEHKILSLFLKPYHIERLLPLVNGDISSQSYYQTRISIRAIGSGGLRGKGLYNGTLNQLSFLPESHNDFIFSVVGEEFGFFGCTIVLALMLVIIYRCVRIGFRSGELLGKLICCGVAGMLAFQSFVNVGVATGLLPNTGMPFPFLSYGGSSMWVNMLCIGLVLNVGMNGKPKSMF